ncbi:hypothetical protein VTO73DRAFT_10416 [Trametes versicolor]
MLLSLRAMGLIALLACTALASFGAGSGIQTIVVALLPLNMQSIRHAHLINLRPPRLSLTDDWLFSS